LHSLTDRHVNLFDYVDRGHGDFNAKAELIDFKKYKAGMDSNLQCSHVARSKFEAKIEYDYSAPKADKELGIEEDRKHGYKKN